MAAMKILCKIYIGALVLTLGACGGSSGSFDALDAAAHSVGRLPADPGASNIDPIAHTGVFDGWQASALEDVTVNGVLTTIQTENIIHFEDGTPQQFEYQKTCLGSGFTARTVTVHIAVQVDADSVQLLGTAANWDLENICAIYFNFTADLPYQISSAGNQLDFLGLTLDRMAP